MKKLNLLVAITAACSALISGLQAASITYSFVNNFNYQNGKTLSGSIVTDGTIGDLTDSSILSWGWTITDTLTSTVLSTVLSTDSGLSQVSINNIIASETQIILRDPTQASLDQVLLSLQGESGQVIWGRFTFPGSFDTFWAYNALGDPFWDNELPGQTLELTGNGLGSWVIAETATAVPEPSTYGLLLGGFTLAVVAMCRRKSTQA